MSDDLLVDVIVIGAGTAGMPCAIEAATAGARVLVIEKSEEVGGTLHVSGGHMSAAGAARQLAAGIKDSPQRHYDDIQRIAAGTARDDLTRLAVDHAAATVDWLDGLGMQFDNRTPRIVYGHKPYETPRTVYGIDEARSILAVLQPAFDALVAQGQIMLWLSTAVEALVTEADTVIGVTVAGPDRPQQVRAKAVVLATGGFGAAPDLFSQIEGAPLVSAARPTSTGDGLRLATDLGAGIGGQGQYIPTFGGLTSPEDPGRVTWSDRPLLVPTERTPWEVYVDVSGARFIAEDEPSIDAKERALVQLPDMRFWCVFDATALAHSPHIVVGWSPEDLDGRAGTHPAVHKGSSLIKLATSAGIDPAGLLQTVEDYNLAVTHNRPDPFGRTARPAAIVTPPFYALANHAVTLITFAGVDVTDDLQVRREDGTCIPGLYAIGEVIGTAATMGKAFCSGMAITPALAFGRLVGKRLGAELTGV